MDRRVLGVPIPEDGDIIVPKPTHLALLMRSARLMRRLFQHRMVLLIRLGGHLKMESVAKLEDVVGVGVGAMVGVVVVVAQTKSAFNDSPHVALYYSCPFLLPHHCVTMLPIVPSCSVHAYLPNTAHWSVSLLLLVLSHNVVTLRVTIDGVMSMAIKRLRLGGKWRWQR